MKALAVVITLVGTLTVMSANCSKKDSQQSQTGSAQTQQASVQLSGEKNIAVKVNDNTISVQDVQREETRLVQQFMGNLSPEQANAMRGELRKQAVQNLLNRMLLKEVVEKERISVPQQDVDARITGIKKEIGSEQAFKDRLASAGTTEELFRKMTEEGLQIEMLLSRQVKNLPEPTEQEMRSFYDSDRSKFVQPEQIRASHVLIGVADTDVEADRVEKSLKAGKLLEEIKRGADFAQIAAQNSTCPSRQRGGDLGFFSRGQMVKPFEDAAFALKVGEVSGIVETRFGFHIIKVTDRQEPRTISYEEAKLDIADYLTGQRKIAVIEQYTGSLRKAAQIQYADSSYALDDK